MSGFKLYSPIILREGQSPTGAVDHLTGSNITRCNNPLCGDQIALQIEADETIHTVAHHTRGCLLTVASASILTKITMGLPFPVAQALSQKLQAHMQSSVGDTVIETDLCNYFAVQAGSSPLLAEFLEGIQPLATARSRTRCLTLPWEALSLALKNP